MHIRQLTLADLDQLQSISRTTFHETFAADNSEADMAHYLEHNLSASRLAQELVNPESRFYFAEDDDGNALGYLKTNTGAAQSEPQDPQALEIERIYVLSAHHGQGVGAALYRQARHDAEQQGAPYLWLGVWEHNRSALQFYQKHGFTAFASHTFILGSDAQTDILMKLDLVPSADDAVPVTNSAAHAADDAAPAAPSKAPNLRRRAIEQRSRARRLLLQTLYQWQITGDPPHLVRMNRMEDPKAREIDEDYFAAAYTYITTRREELGNRLATVNNRKVSLLDPVERAILWIGVYEIDERPDIHPTVTINEAVELAKQFGAADSYKYINATLDKLGKQRRA
ncbi:transcription antitermination factor NusB [uncultured Cardiobacterium sp.]|uniref:transcription antitermination factor NusB n=1 Tax=uncultured Cardiobacterium sp. TaxID=417619 RepID=UPI002618583F|nr:transcription antitermination factor NusB [uncultured Cardiobacterium sp.]